MNLIPNTEFILQNMDEFVLKQLTLTLRLAPLEFDAPYFGAIRVVRECRDSDEGRVWWVSFYREGTHEAGSVAWELIREEPYATVGQDDARINLLARKFRAIGQAYRALDWRSKPSAVFLLAMRLAQKMEENPKLELVPFITNEQFQEQDVSTVEALCMLEVVGAHYQDIRRIDTIVVSRSVRVGIEHDEEILCSWPIVFIGNLVAFNQFIPGPVVSMGNLARHHNVIDLNTKDVRWTCSSEHEIFDVKPVEGRAKMRKYHAAENKWIVYELDAAGIRPVYVDGQEMVVD